MKSAVVFDIDGTISDHSKRVFLAQLKKYEQYSAYMNLDEPIHESVEILKMYRDKGYTIILLTGRKEQHRTITEDWLNKYRIPFDVLFMRDDKDHSKPSKSKVVIYVNMIAPHFKVRALFDDDPSVISNFENIGVKTYQLYRPK